jgi:hypothetical protein
MHCGRKAVFQRSFGIVNDFSIVCILPSLSFSTKLSEIARLEKESGITYAKKQLTLTDPSGLNKVTLQVASKDASALDEYLSSNELSIEGISQKGISRYGKT